jgi:hypothetical protein
LFQEELNEPVGDNKLCLGKLLKVLFAESLQLSESYGLLRRREIRTNATSPLDGPFANVTALEVVRKHKKPLQKPGVFELLDVATEQMESVLNLHRERSDER